MAKKTVTPAAVSDRAWDEAAKAAHYEKVDALVTTAMKTFPTSGTAKDLVAWLVKNSGAGYKNLLRAARAVYGL